MDRQELIDHLSLLEHDLGKHLALPLGMLPAGAAPAEVREALVTSLRRTRRTRGRVLSARQIWAAFRSEAGEALLASGERWSAVCAAVERALAWEERLAGSDIDRDAALADLSAVRPAIRALLVELGRG